MTRKEVHNILDRPRRISVRIKKLLFERQALVDSLMPGGMDTQDRVQKTPEDVMARVIAEVADIDEEIARLQAERIVTLTEIRKLLEGDDVRLAVVSMSYLAQMPMRDIAAEVHYSLKSVYRLRGEGLDMIGERYDDKGS